MPSVLKHASKPAWLRFQQECARWLFLHDGPDPNVRGPKWRSIVGKVARVAGMQHDQRSKHYRGESKWKERFPKWLSDAWQQIVSIAKHDSKAALLMFGEPGGLVFHIITQERHAELLGYEKEWEQGRKQ